MGDDQVTAPPASTCWLRWPRAGCDEIVVLEGGKVSERGDHVRLLAGSGFYARLWAAASEP